MGVFLHMPGSLLNQFVLRVVGCCGVQWLTWPSVFHIFGSIGVLWYLLWEWQAASSPTEDPRCEADERELLAANTSGSKVSHLSFSPVMQQGSVPHYNGSPWLCTSP